MNKMFKYLSLFLLVVLFVVGTHTVFADDNQEPLQIEQGEYNQEILDYIQNNWNHFFSKNELREFANSNSDVVIGEPYGIYAVDQGKMIATHFPIYVDGKCVQILDVFKDSKGMLAWTTDITEEHLEEIDQIKQKNGKYRFEVRDSKAGGAEPVHFVKVEGTAFRSRDNKVYSDIGKPLLSFKPVQPEENIVFRSANYPYEKKLPMDPKETQGSKPWCAAYAGARILSYEFSKDIRAKDIMEWVYWSWWSKPNLDDKSLSDNDLIRYARHLGSSPYYVNRSLYRGEIMEEICNYRMIYAGGKNLARPSSLHAMVVYGYTKDEYYYYWNPWGEKRRSVMSSNTLTTNNGTQYDWIDSIRNFTWK